MPMLVRTPKMSFDGNVGDLGSKNENVTTYEIALAGMDVEKMKAYLLKQAKKKGVEALSFSPVEKRDDGASNVGAGRARGPDRGGPAWPGWVPDCAGC